MNFFTIDVMLNWSLLVAIGAVGGAIGTVSWLWRIGRRLVEIGTNIYDGVNDNTATQLKILARQDKIEECFGKSNKRLEKVEYALIEAAELAAKVQRELKERERFLGGPG